MENLYFIFICRLYEIFYSPARVSEHAIGNCGKCSIFKESNRLKLVLKCKKVKALKVEVAPRTRSSSHDFRVIDSQNSIYVDLHLIYTVQKNNYGDQIYFHFAIFCKRHLHYQSNENRNDIDE